MTPLIKFIHILAKVLEWFGNSFAALGMCLAGKANVLREKVIEKLQIRKEKLKRKDKSTVYRLFVSHDAGMIYQLGMTNTNLKQLVAFGKDLDKQMLRWYIMDGAGQYVEIACKIHGSIVGALEDGDGEKLIIQMVKKEMEREV